MKRITDEIAEARKQAQTLAIPVSFHGDETDGEDTTVPAMFLETFSRACIDAGAHAVYRATALTSCAALRSTRAV